MSICKNRTSNRKPSDKKKIQDRIGILTCKFVAIRLMEIHIRQLTSPPNLCLYRLQSFKISDFIKSGWTIKLNVVEHREEVDNKVDTLMLKLERHG